MEMDAAHEKLEKSAVKKSFPNKFKKFAAEEKVEAKAAKKTPGRKVSK